MFNSLNGIITGKFSKKIYLQTQGIEWSIIVPESCLDEFPCVGKECKVYKGNKLTHKLRFGEPGPGKEGSGGDSIFNEI